MKKKTVEAMVQKPTKTRPRMPYLVCEATDELKKKAFKNKTFQKTIIQDFLDFKPITSIGGMCLVILLDYAHTNNLSYAIRCVIGEGNGRPMFCIRRSLIGGTPEDVRDRLGIASNNAKTHP